MNIQNPNRKKNMEKYGLGSFAALNVGSSLDPRQRKASQKNTNQGNAAPTNNLQPVPPPNEIHAASSSFQHPEQPRTRSVTPSAGFANFNQQNDNMRFQNRPSPSSPFSTLSNESFRQRSESRERQSTERGGQFEVSYARPTTSCGFGQNRPEIYPPSSTFSPNQFYGTYSNPAQDTEDNIFEALSDRNQKRRSTSVNSDSTQTKKPKFDNPTQEIQQLRLDKIDLESTVIRLKSEIEQLNKTNEKYKNEAHLNSKLLAQTVSNISNNSNTKSDVDALMDKNKSLSLKIENLRTEVKNLHAYRQRKDSEFETAQQRINELRDQVRSHNADYDRLKNRLENKSDELEKTKRKLDAIREENEKLLSNNTQQLNSELNDLRSKSSADQQQIEKLQAEKKALFDEVDSLKILVASFEKQWKEHMATDTSRVDASAKNTQETQTETDADMLKLTKENEKLIKDKANLTATLQMYLEELNQIKNEKHCQESVKNKGDNVQEKTAEHTQKEIDAMAELADFKSRYEELETSFKESSERETELEEKNMALDSELRRTKKFLLDLNNAQEAAKDLRKKVKKQETEIAELISKLEASEKAKDSVNQLYKTMCETIETERAAYTKLTESDQAKSTELKELKEQLQKMTEKTSSSIPAADKDVTEDESTQLEQSESNAVGFDTRPVVENTSLELKKWVSRLTKKLNASQSSEKTLLAEKERLTNENNQLKSELTHWRAPPIPFPNVFPPRVYLRGNVVPPFVDSSPFQQNYYRPPPRGKSYMNPPK